MLGFPSEDVIVHEEPVIRKHKKSRQHADSVELYPYLNSFDHKGQVWTKQDLGSSKEKEKLQIPHSRWNKKQDETKRNLANMSGERDLTVEKSKKSFYPNIHKTRSKHRYSS